MSSKQHLHTLMAEIGPCLNLLELTEYEDDDSWWLVFDQQTVVIADYVAAEDRLVLSATVATPAAADRLRIYATVLQYNYHWEDTGSIRMALEGPAGSLVQISDLRVTGLDLQTLHNGLSNFNDKIHAWREALHPQTSASTQTATTSGEENNQPDTAPTPGIRV